MSSAQNEVTCWMCESTADLRLMEDQLKQFGICHDVYCPFPPYMHKYDKITDFVQKVEEGKKGEPNFWYESFLHIYNAMILQALW